MVKKAQTIKSTTEKLFARIEELESNYRRALADYQNQERRHHEMSSNLVKMASAPLLEKLLLSLDGLRLAQSHLKNQGLQMVIDQIQATFTSEGLTEIKTDGEKFDPLTMDCVELIPGKKDLVMETITPGYFLFDKVLRPAKVKVGSGSTPVIPSAVEGSHSIKQH